MSRFVTRTLGAALLVAAPIATAEPAPIPAETKVLEPLAQPESWFIEQLGGKRVVVDGQTLDPRFNICSPATRPPHRSLRTRPSIRQRPPKPRRAARRLRPFVDLPHPRDRADGCDARPHKSRDGRSDPGACLQARRYNRPPARPCIFPWRRLDDRQHRRLRPRSALDSERSEGDRGVRPISPRTRKSVPGRLGTMPRTRSHGRRPTPRASAASRR